MTGQKPERPAHSWRKEVPRGTGFDHDSEVNDKPSRRKQLDKLTNALGEPGFYHRMRWSWLCRDMGGVRYPLEVSRYYQNSNVAVDIMPAETFSGELELKSKLFKEHGIKYHVLNDMTGVSKLLESMGVA